MNADVTVREVMDREFVGVNESDGLVETVDLVLREEADAALVLRGTEPVGLVTDRDVLGLLVEGPAPGEATVGDAMTPSVPTVQATVPLADAADRIATSTDRLLVVTDASSGDPIGLLTTHDLLEAGAFRPAEAGTAGVAPEDVERAVQVERGGTDFERGSGEVDPRGGNAGGTEAHAGATGGFQDQGICERCGTLTGDLAGLNGQLLCADCRDL